MFGKLSPPPPSRSKQMGINNYGGRHSMEQLGARRLTPITKCDDQVTTAIQCCQSHQELTGATMDGTTQDADGWRTKMAEAQRAVLLALGIEPARLADADAAASAAAAQVPLLSSPSCLRVTRFVRQEALPADDIIKTSSRAFFFVRAFWFLLFLSSLIVGRRCCWDAQAICAARSLPACSMRARVP